MKTSLILAMLLLTGCAAGTIKDFNVEGAKGSALCVMGGPGGRLGIGPGGIITGAKVNDDFIGVIALQADCSIVIQSYPSPKIGPALIN